MSVMKYERFTHDSLALGQADNKGNLFIGENGDYHDLSTVNVLHQGVDTIRQLYHGTVKVDVIKEIEQVYEQGAGAFGYFFGYQFKVSASGKRSGYRYRLQNNDLGVIILIGSYFKELEYEGSHLKIELSPHLIHKSGFDGVCDLLAHFAKEVYGYHYRGVGCAVHLCVDVQGWTIPYDMENRFVTRSRRLFRVNGMDDLQMDIDGFSARFNRTETITFGSPKGVQVSCYDKEEESRKSDKFDFWKSVWGDDYDSSQRVTRVELRLHQVVTREFGNYQQALDGTSYDHKFETFRELKDYLPQIWQSMLMANRLDNRPGSKHIDAFWQFLHDDIYFSCTPYTGKPYKRVRKSHVGAERNIAQYIGHSLTLFARKNFTGSVAYDFFTKSGLYDVIKSYYEGRGLNQHQFIEWLDETILNRRLVRKCA